MIECAFATLLTGWDIALSMVFFDTAIGLISSVLAFLIYIIFLICKAIESKYHVDTCKVLAIIYNVIKIIMIYERSVLVLGAIIITALLLTIIIEDLSFEYTVCISDFLCCKYAISQFASHNH